jgi:YidC/Oxa1 family membrane protein insertase
MPLFISLFLAVRDMSAIPIPGMTKQGVLWFTDLSVPDPYMILPVVAGLGFLAVLEVGAEAGGMGGMSGVGIKNVMRGVAMLSIPFTAYFSSGYELNRLISGCFATGFLQTCSRLCRLGHSNRIQSGKH